MPGGADMGSRQHAECRGIHRYGLIEFQLISRPVEGMKADF